MIFFTITYITLYLVYTVNTQYIVTAYYTVTLLILLYCNTVTDTDTLLQTKKAGHRNCYLHPAFLLEEGLARLRVN